MKVVVWLGSVLVLAGVSSALAALHPFGNPRHVQPQPGDSLLDGAQIPEKAGIILGTKCAACHSDATVWPSYSHFAPASWLVERDVVEGRAHLNLSQWRQISEDRRSDLVQEIAHEARIGAMPPVQYRMVHWGSALTSADVATLSALAPQESDGGMAADAGDPVRGKSVFERRCTGCHAVDVDREGPHLHGVFGRRAGSVPGFEYSAPLMKSGIVWDEKSLETWLRGTDEAVPGSAMGFSVPKAQDRADIIAFLKSIR